MKKKADFNLTQREEEVLSWVIEGKTDWEIGRILTISQRTVRFHIDNIIKKFGVSNKLQAAVTAVKNRMVGNLENPPQSPFTKGGRKAKLSQVNDL